MLLANPPVLALIGTPWSEVEGRTDLELLADREQAEAITRNDRRLIEANWGRTPVRPEDDLRFPGRRFA
jgi:hypothetical protein